MWVVFVQFFPFAIAYTVPMLVTSLGGLYSEHGGVSNIGLEGLMVVGAFASALTITLTEATLGANALPLGLLVGVAAGAIFSLLHAFATIHLHSEQILSGMAINLLAPALTLYLARSIGASGRMRILEGIAQMNVPFFSRIPLIGPLFFSQSYWTTWLCLLIWALSWIVLYKTSFGLRLRSCGEHPSAVASAGINVSQMRYAGVLISGALAGLGGAVMLVTFALEFNGSVAGLGFLSLAALIFGRRKPLGILGASFFFGIVIALANNAQDIPFVQMIPPLLLKVFPYVAALFALVIFSKTTRAPKSVDNPL